MSTNTSSRKVFNEKVRLIGSDPKDIPISLTDNLEEDDDNSVAADEDDGDISITVEDEDAGEDDEDDIGSIMDDEDVDVNSDDEIDPAIEHVNAATTRPVNKHGKVGGLQALDVPVPPQFFASQSVDEDDSDYDIDVANMSGNVTGDDEYDDDDDDEDPETYLQKFETDINQNLLLTHHPTQFTKNDSEISALCQLTRNESNNVIDPLHKTTPFLTKYERTRVLGQRAKQINSGSKPYVVVPDHILDGYIIAQMELVQKRLPFIIERPIHGGGCEYWRVRDLEVL